MSQWRSEIFRLTNAERSKEGLPAYRSPSSALQSAASTRAQEIGVSFSHTRPNGTVCFTAIKEAGALYSYAGENIASGTAGSLKPADVIAMWMASDGHKKNIMSTNFTMLAVGYHRANGRDYFVQLFIKPQ